MTTESVKQQALVSRTATPVLPTEIGATAAAAQVKALVEARFVLAIKNPRNMEQVRLDLLKECSRPAFCHEEFEGKGNSALYRKPVGDGKFAEGLGIRFAEVAARCMGNLLDDAIIIQDDEKEIVKYCFVLDLEKNVSWGDTVRGSKFVERKFLRDGDVPISSRTNSQGQITYTLPASEDAMTTKVAALTSKMMRTLILRLVPGDLQDQCIEKIKEVRRNKAAEDPDEAIRRVIDGMARQNVNVVMLEAFLGHPIQQITPAEIVNLQGLYASLRDGESTWAEIMADVEESKRVTPKAKTEGDGRGVAAAREKVEAEKSQTQPPVPPPPPAPSTPPPPPPVSSAPPPWTAPAPAPAPSPAPAPPPIPAAGGQPPWIKGPVPAPAMQTQAPSSLSLEEQVAEMATARPPRKKPIQPSIKRIPLPEFVDIVAADGPDGPATEAQIQRMEGAFNKIDGCGPPDGHDFTETILAWTGVAPGFINSATAETLAGILESAALAKPKQ